MRFYYVLFLVNKVDDVYYYMADSLNWYSIEIYIGKNTQDSFPYPFGSISRANQRPLYRNHMQLRIDLQDPHLKIHP